MRSSRVTDWSAIRVVPELRAFHLDLAGDLPDVLFLFLARKYDAPAFHDAQNVRGASFPQIVWILIRARCAVLEMWEPLWVRLLARNILLSVVWRASPRWRSRRIVCYAMENNDFRSLVAGDSRNPFQRPAVAILRLLIGMFVRVFYTRIAFAGPQSRATYESLSFVAGVAAREFPDLPRRVPLVEHQAQGGSCIFVGRLESRKGIKSLMVAWPEVEAAVPTARLTLVGDGPEAPSVTRFVQGAPGNRAFAGSVDHEHVAAYLASSDVLVLPSRREGRWREQTGLPIREALQAGLTVVTTSETGLAPWLSERGHKVVEPDDPRALAGAIIAALTEPLHRRAVSDSLPTCDGEFAASKWLHRAVDRQDTTS